LHGLRSRASEAECGLLLDLQTASDSAVKAAAKDETGYLGFEIHGGLLVSKKTSHACGGISSWWSILTVHVRVSSR